MATSGPKEIFGHQTLYREIGYYLTHLEQYEKSLHFFNQAPENRRALIGRAWSKSKLCRYQQALEDLDKALKLNDNDLITLAYKSLNTYLCCEFEEAMVQNIRQIPNRKKPDSFVVGAMHCKDAIQNCLGIRAGHPLRDYFLIIRKLAWIRNEESTKPFKPKPRLKKKKGKKIQGYKLIEPPVIQKDNLKSEDSDTIRDYIYTPTSSNVDIAPPEIQYPFRPLQKFTNNIHNVMAEKYLGVLSHDRKFLKIIIDSRGLKSPNNQGNEKLHQLIKYGLKRVKYNQELLRTRKPYYFYKYQETKFSTAAGVRQKMLLKLQQVQARNYAIKLIVIIQRALYRKDLTKVVETCEILRTHCETTTIQILPERQQFLSNLYNLHCQGFYELLRLNKKQKAWDQEKRIQVMLGLPLSREPSLDSVIKEFRPKYVDWHKKIEIYSERLKVATTSEEIAWLCHELCRFYTEIKHYDLAKLYARKVIKEGRSLNDLRWVINATMLMTKINVSLENINDAIADIENVLNESKPLQDENLREFLMKTLEVIGKIEREDELKRERKRETAIIKLLETDKMKSDATFMFRKMSIMPDERRMNVMPGVRITTMPPHGDHGKHDVSRKNRTSIMPGLPEEVKPTPITPQNQPKLDVKTVDRKGKEFVELIQYHID